MNLLLPIVVFIGMLAVGMPRPAPVIGMVESASPAAEAGLRPGDRIVAIDGSPVAWWGEVDDAVRASAGERLQLDVDRAGERTPIALDPAERSGFDEFGEVKPVGWAGLGHARLRALLGVPDAGSLAHRAGLRSGDLVTAVAGQLVAALAAADPSAELRVDVHRGGDAGQDLERTLLPGRTLEALGIGPASVLVDAVEPDSPAAAAGFEARDLILSVDGQPVGSFGSFAEVVRTGGGKPLHLVYARDGEARETSITPELIPTDIGLGIEEPRYRIGIRGAETLVVGEVALDRERNVLVSFPRAVSMTTNMTLTFLRGFGKLVTGEVSHKNLAGPIGIAEIAGDAFERGWEVYLSIMVLISINLGILNLLPIPILDGGQALLFLVEGVKRSPLSLRTREIVQQVGLTVLVMLMGLAFWNDISRHWAKVIDWIRSGPGL
jgi:regulator of sigma E protease